MSLFKRSTGETADGPEFEAAVEKLLEALSEDPELDEWGMVEALTNRGVERVTAIRVVTFAPFAFGRMFLQELGVSVFPQVYEVRGEKSRTKKPLHFEDTPEYLAAQAVAERVDHNAAGVLVLRRESAEVNVALKLGHEGSMAGVRFTSPIIMWDIL